MIEDEDLEIGKERDDEGVSRQERTEEDATEIPLPAEPSPPHVTRVQGIDMAGQANGSSFASGKSNGTGLKAARRSHELALKEGGGSRNNPSNASIPGAFSSDASSIAGTDMATQKGVEARRFGNSQTPGAHHESSANSRESRKTQRNTTASPGSGSSVQRADDDAMSQQGSIATAISREERVSREERKAQRVNNSSHHSIPETRSLSTAGSTHDETAGRSNSSEFASGNLAVGSNHNSMMMSSHSHETAETAVTNEMANDNAHMELQAEVVDDSYVEEVERLREENLAIKAEQLRQQEEQQRRQRQQQDSMAVVIAEDVTGPNYTRQIICCAVCLMIVIVSSVFGALSGTDDKEATCDLPPKEVIFNETLLTDVAAFHEEAIDWMLHNDTWLPSTNCDNATDYILERYALVVLYLDTQGPNWYTNNNKWLDSESESASVCEWQMIVCDEAQHVVEIDAVEKNFVGKIPTELGLLTSLTRLNLDINKLTGTLPTEIGKWTDIQGFYMAKNQLTGTIPTEAGRMTSLVKINVIENDLTGTIPTEIGMLTAATRLLLFDSKFSGPLPSEIGNLSLLKSIEFYNNAHTGYLPSEFGLLTSMTWVGLYNNSFSGSLPTEFGLLTNMKKVELHSNSFSGTLPSEFGLLTQMTRLDVRNNTLEGNLPAELGQVTTLTKFMVVNNQFTGSIPPLPDSIEICELAPRRETGNCFTNLEDQPEICEVVGNCPTLDPAVLLADYSPLNQDAIEWMRNDRWSPPYWVSDRLAFYLQRYVLASLWFETDGLNWFNEGNWMSSLSVCDWHRILCNATEHVVFVDLVASNLRGSIPAELGLLQSLTRLNLDNNRLTGTLPSELALLSNLAGMFIYGNKLSGSIPSEWGNLSALTRLNLANNVGLSGTLPTEIGMWTSCTRIMLFGNQLSGTIPPLLSLSALTQLELNDNLLTGTIPNLHALSALEHLDVRNNRLIGRIPTLPLNLTNCQIASADETGNCFCTDSYDGMSCNVEGNCPAGANVTAACDIEGDETGLNTTLGDDGAGLNATDGGNDTGLNTTHEDDETGLNITDGGDGTGLNATDGYDSEGNHTVGMNATSGCFLGIGLNCTMAVNGSGECGSGGNCNTTGVNNTAGCDTVANCTTGVNTTVGCNTGDNCQTPTNGTIGQ